ncbi:MAG: hypothetical protein PHC34_07655 [Candidatus Gastranaerophilales bacterium]|nr:hypothetical protein [Candidatus Gastranaerophilales bacterium]
MSNRILAKLFVVFAITGGMAVSFSACTQMEKPTIGTGPVSMQQQQEIVKKAPVIVEKEENRKQGQGT